MKTTVYGLAAALVLVGCHTITEELPTQPTGSPASPILTVPIPKIPVATPTPTATPTPSPTPGATPTPSPTPTPGAGGCGDPLPPGIARMNTKIHLKGPKYTLDTTPLVHDAAYCKKVGFPDRNICPVRPEGDPERTACEAYAVGKAIDTGRAGPTWYRNGKLCTGQDGDCENHPENQYLLWAYGNGYYEACTEDDVCGGVLVER